MHEDAANEAVLFSSGLGGAAAYWDPQRPAFEGRFRIITYDQAGTGQNKIHLPLGYTICDMADEVATLLDRHDVSTCHFVGHALGGLVGLAFALRHPSRLKKLAVINSWAKMDLHTERCFEARLSLLDHCGLQSYIRAQPIFLYPASWASANVDRLLQEDRAGVAHFQGENNLKMRLAAMRAWNPAQALGQIKAEVLAVATKDDVLVPWTASRALADQLLNCQMAQLDEGGHACNVTNPDAINKILVDFLTAQAPKSM